jgi:ribosome biogenesis SPOUT family RNA methylase Rps3
MSLLLRGGLLGDGIPKTLVKQMTSENAAQMFYRQLGMSSRSLDFALPVANFASLFMEHALNAFAMERSRCTHH